jgi:hypothetical protein
VDTADVLAGVDHVVASGIADPDRLGVGGHSYGGILTDQVIARDPRFKGAVASAGAANMFGMWGVDMYIREYSLELGLPWRDQEAFERVSYPFFHADKITTATLFLCNELDDNVPCVGSMQMYEALKIAGRADAARDLPERIPRPHGAELPPRPHGADARLVWALFGRRTGAAVALQERLKRLVRQRLRRVTAVADHVARRNHRVDDGLFRRLCGGLEELVELLVLEELRRVERRAFMALAFAVENATKMSPEPLPA